MSGAKDGLAADRPSRHILIADDSDTYRAVATRVLVDAGYRVTGVADGRDALALLGGEACPFHLLLLELNLPRLRGLDLIRRVRETRGTETLPILLVSDAITANLRRLLADLRLDAHLTKNHALRELLYQVDALLIPMHAERRRSIRRLAGVPVNYWLDSRLCLQECFDVSEEGMFVVVADEEPIGVGTELALRFWLPTADRLIVCDAVVVWRNAAAGDLSMSHPPGMGLRFLRVADDDLERIRAFMAASP